MKTISFCILSALWLKRTAPRPRFFMACCPVCGWPIASGFYAVTITLTGKNRLLACYATCCGHSIVIPKFFMWEHAAETEMLRAFHLMKRFGNPALLLTVPKTPRQKWARIAFV